MCYACRPGDGFAKADPLTVVHEFIIYSDTAREQRLNLESSRERNSLCEKHLANYEAVVEALETYSAKKWPKVARIACYIRLSDNTMETIAELEVFLTGEVVHIGHNNPISYHIQSLYDSVGGKPTFITHEQLCINLSRNFFGTDQGVYVDLDELFRIIDLLK